MLRPEELDAHVPEVSTLYLARACHDVLLDSVAPPPHAAEYMARLGLRHTSCVSFTRDVVAPALTKKLECLPAAVRARLHTAGIA